MRAQNLVPQPESVIASTIVTTSSTQTLALRRETELIEVIVKNGDAYIQFSIDGVLTTATASTGGFRARVNEGQVRHYIISFGTSLSIAGSTTSTEVTVIEYSAS